jgi:hypothetical protein
MATVDSLDDYRLKTLARKIDPEILKHLGQAELQLRVETAASLYDDAFRQESSYERHRLEREADRTLNAVSLMAFMAGARLLSDQIDRVKESRGDHRAVLAATRELEQFAKRNPQPGLSDVTVMSEIAGISNAVDKPRRRFFRRSR